MGQYMYRVTAKVVKLSDGRKAHVAQFAYKPFRTWDGEGWNAKMHFKTGCVASENMKLASDLIVTLSEDGTDGRLYHNKRGLKTFLDDSTFGYDDVMPALGTAKRVGKIVEVTVGY